MIRSFAGRARSLLRLLIICCVVETISPVAQSAPEAESEPDKKPPRARISVDGLGWWSNRETRVSLERLLGSSLGPTIDASTIEDAAFLIVSSLVQEGYLRPEVEARITATDGRVLTDRFTAELTTFLPRPLVASEVTFQVRRGVRSVFEDVSLTGLDGEAAKSAVRYFRPADGLWQTREARAFSPARLQRAADSLQGDLRNQGFAQANVQTSVTREDLATGEVDVSVHVERGPRWVVEGVRLRLGSDTPLRPQVDPREGMAFTSAWQQDTSELIRHTYYRAGYPDVRVSFEIRPKASGSPVEPRPVEVVAQVEPGPAVRVGEVRFEGNRHTRASVLRRRLRIDARDPLNPLQVERARYRLARLGVFSRIDVRYEPRGDAERDVVFVFRESPRWETNLLLGYGSYEQIRAGVEWRQSNLLGRAHQSRLQLVQSLKSTRADYSYTIPELFGERLDGTARLFALRREEQAFVREEYGGSLIFRRRLPWRDTDARLGYTYQTLRNQDNELTTRLIDDRLVKVGSIELAVTQDRRDNALKPHRGYRLFSRIEAASKAFGGEVEYQIFEVGGSYHRALRRHSWIHVGLTHGFITTLGDDDDRQLPVNKRFFPGGESSVRGYTEGEAAPRGPDGRFIGAKVQTVVNVEFEQQVVGNWSAVVFLDAVGAAAELSDYPSDRILSSLGLGVRYNTIIGPLRLEYGHNLNPRSEDPSGALHLSIGFPF